MTFKQYAAIALIAGTIGWPHLKKYAASSELPWLRSLLPMVEQFGVQTGDVNQSRLLGRAFVATADELLADPAAYTTASQVYDLWETITTESFEGLVGSSDVNAKIDKTAVELADLLGVPADQRGEDDRPAESVTVDAEKVRRAAQRLQQIAADLGISPTPAG